MIRNEERSLRRLLALGWAVVATVPIVSAVLAAMDGWVPAIDTGMIATLTVDSLSSKPPLVGVPTSLGEEGGLPLHHLGPLGLWLLALPTRAWGAPGHGLLAGAGITGAASVAIVGNLVRRRGELRLEAILLALVAVMVVALGGAILSDPFNPYLGVLPLLVLLVSIWGVMSGHHRQLWVAVASGSLVAQTHLGYVPLVGALMVLAAATLAFDVWRRSGPARRRLTSRVIPIALLLGVALWSGPIIDQLWGSQNLSRLIAAQTGDRATVGMEHGVDLLVEMTAIPPLWMTGRASDGEFADPAAVRVLLSILAIATVVASTAWAVRRRERAMAALGLVALVCLPVATLSSSRMLDLGGVFGTAQSMLMYRLFWWPVGVVFLLSLIWGLTRVVDSRRLPSVDGPAISVGQRRTIAGLILLAVVVTPLGYQTRPAAFIALSRKELTLADAIGDHVGPSGSVHLRRQPEGVTEPESSNNAHYSYMLIAQLRLRGIEVTFPDDDDDGVELAHWAANPRHGDEDAVIVYRLNPEAHHEDLPGYRLLAAVPPPKDQPLNILSMPSGVYVRDDTRRRRPHRGIASRPRRADHPGRRHPGRTGQLTGRGTPASGAEPAPPPPGRGPGGAGRRRGAGRRGRGAAPPGGC